MEGKDPTEFTLREKAAFVAQGVMSGKIFELAKPANVSLWKELSSYFTRPEVKEISRARWKRCTEPERRTFSDGEPGLRAAHLSSFREIRPANPQRKHYRKHAGAERDRADPRRSRALHLRFSQPGAFAKMAARNLPRADRRNPAALQNRKRAWFTDTLDDVNGVATTIRKMTVAGAAAGEELIVVTSRNDSQIDDIPIKNFRPIGEFELPEYELQKLSFPPILQMLDYIQREQFTEIIISTPGPIGLTGLLAAKMFNLQTSGIYHTDFPQYIRILTEDSFLESLAWSYMQWFYGQLDTVFVNSEEYRQSWIDRGFDPNKLKILPRGLDTELFTPTRRDAQFWKSPAPRTARCACSTSAAFHARKISTCSRAAYRQLREERIAGATLSWSATDLTRRRSPRVARSNFHRLFDGKELATAYASSDIFVFPSTTDTFGNVIIEAQASGIPVIVSDLGGPKELVSHGLDGLITKSHNVEDFTDAIRALVNNPQLRAEMAKNARARVVDRSWPSAFRKFWAATEL